jgi:hypothetical protein
MNNAARTVLTIGASVIAGGLMEGAAFGQAAAPAPVPLYPGPAFPTCIVKAPTDCRLADGKPDLTGLWAAGNPSTGSGQFASGASEQVFAGRGGTFVGFEADGGLFRTTQAYGVNPPIYRPEKWEAIIEAEYNGNFEDPLQRCFPNGVPRSGAPTAIVTIPNQPWVILIYTLKEIRMIPTDGRSHNVTNVAAETWNGDSVAKWEGDTLVIDTIGFTDASWLAKSGFLHGFQMKVTERLTRKDNAITWEATVEDPEWLAQPWKIAPVTRNLSMDPNATIYEPQPCDDIDRLHTTSHTRSG